MTVRNVTATLARRHVWLVPLLILLAAFAVRFVYLHQIESMPTFNYPIMDEKYHVDLARHINSQEGPVDEPFYRAPLYPYVLAALYRITAQSLYWVRFVQILLGSFLPLLVFGLGLVLFDRTVAFWSAAIAVFYPTFLYFDASLLITSLMVLLTTLLLWQLYRLQSNLTTRDAILSGLLLSLAGLARPNILLLGPALLIWVVLIAAPRFGPKRAWLRFVLIGLTAAVVVLPVTIRNYVVADDFVLVSWQGGFNFYVGNNRQASGWSATTAGIDPTWGGGYRDAITIAEQDEGRPLKRSEVSDYWYRRAWDEIRQAPASWVALQFKKVRLFLNGYEIPNNQDIYLAGQFAPILRPLMFRRLVYFPYGLLAPLAVIGLVLSLGRWRTFLLVYLLMAAYVTSLLLFFVCARFRQPLIPILILFAVYGVTRLVDLLRKRQIKNVAVLFTFLALLLLESNHDMLDLDPHRTAAENHLLLGNSYLEQGDPSRAEREFLESIAADAAFAQGYNNLGMLSANRKQFHQAAQYFEKALQADPMTVETYFNLATVQLDLGDHESAINVLLRAKQIHPYNDFVFLKLGMTYYEAGQLEPALRAAEQAMRLNPQSPLNRDVYRQIREAVADTTPRP